MWVLWYCDWKQKTDLMIYFSHTFEKELKGPNRAMVESDQF